MCETERYIVLLSIYLIVKERRRLFSPSAIWLFGFAFGNVRALSWSGFCGRGILTRLCCCYCSSSCYISAHFSNKYEMMDTTGSVKNRSESLRAKLGSWIYINLWHYHMKRSHHFGVIYYVNNIAPVFVLNSIIARWFTYGLLYVHILFYES